MFVAKYVEIDVHCDKLYFKCAESHKCHRLLNGMYLITADLSEVSDEEPRSLAPSETVCHSSEPVVSLALQASKQRMPPVYWEAHNDMGLFRGSMLDDSAEYARSALWVLWPKPLTPPPGSLEKTIHWNCEGALAPQPKLLRTPLEGGVRFSFGSIRQSCTFIRTKFNSCPISSSIIAELQKFGKCFFGVLEVEFNGYLPLFPPSCCPSARPEKGFFFAMLDTNLVAPTPSLSAILNYYSLLPKK